VYHGASFLPFPGEIAYPSTGQGIGFTTGLMQMMYGYGVTGKLGGLINLLKASISKPKMQVPLPNHTDDLKEAKKE